MSERRILLILTVSVLALFFALLLATGCAPATFTGPTVDPTPIVDDPTVTTRPALPSECSIGGEVVLVNGKIAAAVCNVILGPNCDNNNDHGGDDHGHNGDNSGHDNNNH